MEQQQRQAMELFSREKDQNTEAGKGRNSSDSFPPRLLASSKKFQKRGESNKISALFLSQEG